MRLDVRRRQVRPVQKQVSRLCTSTSTMRQNRPELLRVMALLDFLHDVNETADGLVNYEEFHNKEVDAPACGMAARVSGLASMCQCIDMSTSC